MKNDSALPPRLLPLFADADRLWAAGAAATSPGELSCRAGCYGCCVGPFEISLAEALLVRTGVALLPEAERAEVLSRAARILRESAAVFPGDAEAGLLDPDRTEEEDDRYFDSVSEVACPMLELPTGRCRIYDHRPITCRTYGLAWKRGDEPVHPACPLNFVGAPDRADETAIDLDRLLANDQRLAEVATEAGWPGGAETTIAHATVGSVFGRLPG